MTPQDQDSAPPAQAPRSPAGVLFHAGLGSAAPALLLPLSRLGWDEGSAASLVCAALAAGWAVRPPDAPSGAAGALGALLSAALLPLTGIRAACAAGVTLTAAGWIAGRGGKEVRFGLGTASAAALGLVLGGGALWSRCGGALAGQPLYALAGTLSACYAAAGAAAWARRRAQWPEAMAGLGGPALLGAALYILVCLRLLRFIGLNAGAWDYLRAPLRAPSDLLFILAQPCAAWAPLCFLSALAARRSERQGGAWLAALCAAAACHALSIVAGPARALASIAGLLLAAGAGIIMRSSPGVSTAPVRAALAAALAGAWLGVSRRDDLRDVWINRLNALSPGGEFLYYRTAPRESVGVFKFRSGERVLLQDGVADLVAPADHKRAAHLAILAAPSVRRVLWLGLPHPAALRAALSHGASLEAVSPLPSSRELLSRMVDSAAADSGRLRLVQDHPRRFLAAESSRGYDVVIAAPPAHLESAAAAFLLTAESLAQMRSRLGPDGVLAVWLSGGAPSSRARVLATAARGSPHLQACPIGEGLLLLATPSPLRLDSEAWTRRLGTDAWMDDPGLISIAGALPCRSQTASEADSAAADSDDKPRLALPLARLLLKTSK